MERKRRVQKSHFIFIAVDLWTRVKVKESSLVRIMDQMTSGQGSEKGCHGSIIPELEKETSISFENVRSVNCEFKNHK